VPIAARSRSCPSHVSWRQAHVWPCGEQASSAVPKDLLRTGQPSTLGRLRGPRLVDVRRCPSMSSDGAWSSSWSLLVMVRSQRPPGQGHPDRATPEAVKHNWSFGPGAAETLTPQGPDGSVVLAAARCPGCAVPRDAALRMHSSPRPDGAAVVVVVPKSPIGCRSESGVGTVAARGTPAPDPSPPDQGLQQDTRRTGFAVWNVLLMRCFGLWFPDRKGGRSLRNLAMSAR
jgi:hypothetical protein